MESIGEILKGLNPTLAQTIQKGYEEALANPPEKVFYNCDICEDRGYVYHTYPVGHKHQGLMWGEPCICKPKEIRANKLRIAGIRGDRKIEDFKTDRYTDVFHMEGVKVDLEEFIRKYKGNNLFLTGNTGLGKTFASEIIFVELLKRDVDIDYKRLNKVLDDLMAYKMADMEDYTKRKKKLEEVEVLILDDMGAEALSGSKLAEIFNLIDERQKQGKSTVISSNLSIDEIETKYNDRIASRLKGYYQILEFQGKDLRYGE